MTNGGHLFGETFIKGDFYELQNKNGDKIINYNTTDGLTIQNLAMPTNDNDAATKKYVDDNAGGGGGNIVTATFAGFDAAEIGVACDTISATGKIPVLKMEGSYFHCSSSWEEGDDHGYQFSGLSCSLSNGEIATIYIDWIEVNYTSNEWSGGAYSTELSPTI